MSSSERISPFSPPSPTEKDQRHRWERLYGASKALAWVSLAQRLTSPLVIITSDHLSVERLTDELQFFSGNDVQLPILAFPDWETLPYDRFSPYQDIVSDRLATLARLPSMTRGIVLVSIQTVMHRLAPPQYILANSLSLRQGQRLDIEAFRTQIQASGYRCLSEVSEHGEYAVRGSLLDLYPMGSKLPYRIDLFDDEIDSIRTFDPETQRSIDSVTEIQLLPAHEFALTEKAIGRFRGAWRARFEGRPTDCPIYQDVSDGVPPAGIEYYLPLFFEQTSVLFDYTPAAAVTVLDEGVDAAAEAFWQELNERYEQGRYDAERPLLEPHEVFVPVVDIYTQIKTRASIKMAGEGKGHYCEFATRAPMQIPIDARVEEPLRVFKQFLDSFAGKVLIAAESKGRRETLLELFKHHQLRVTLLDSWEAFLSAEVDIALIVAPITRGAILDEPRLALISETQLFGEHVAQQRRRRAKRDSENIFRNLTELRIGAPVVHEDHGVGRYRDLITLNIGDVTGEYLQLEYADGDILYVPVAALHLINRYSGLDPDHAPLHKLGSGQWQRARAKAAERLRDVAAELLEIYARRAAKTGHVFSLDTDAYQTFVQGFPFEETPDQQTAIEAVLHDMQAPQPMDRLICGDVGFGKTEVAMRAAFIAVSDGKQVAVLVPTTLLAQQHHENFKDRFADWPVHVEQLSRFRGKKAQGEVLRGLKAGNVDIVIGTHKLLQDDVGFKQLGLVILDEEHRFGVRQKERLKALRAETDILTLTATPIPRSLNMALSGTRELSIIATPPSRRLAIKTFVREWDDRLLREAILREINRGGQVYFLYNKVETIEKIARQLQELVPEARTRIAHGQMRERELEQVMTDFYHRRFHVLVCTTIIETGIDVPSANTIIIQRADKFGLAQLYQLRGRVGRSHHRAYAYLLVPSRKALTADAKRRLEAIESLEELGVGFTIATHDLEIRGAGEILGEEQSGHIQEIGYGMYTALLERTVQALKAGREPDLELSSQSGAEVELHVPALLPEDYLPDVHTRLIMYKRIASAKDDDELRTLQEEIVDRFGLLPEPTKNLFKITELKLRATPMGIRKIDLGAHGGRIEFAEEANVDPTSLINLIQSQPAIYRLDKDHKLRVSMELPEAAMRIRELNTLFEKLTVKEAA